MEPGIAGSSPAGVIFASNPSLKIGISSTHLRRPSTPPLRSAPPSTPNTLLSPASPRAPRYRPARHSAPPFALRLTNAPRRLAPLFCTMRQPALLRSALPPRARPRLAPHAPRCPPPLPALQRGASLRTACSAALRSALPRRPLGRSGQPHALPRSAPLRSGLSRPASWRSAPSTADLMS